MIQFDSIHFDFEARIVVLPTLWGLDTAVSDSIDRPLVGEGDGEGEGDVVGTVGAVSAWCLV